LNLEKTGDNVRTADDFIILCGSRSLFGVLYKIRFFDGKTIEAEDFFWEKLETFILPQK
jgi:hypothetical protein